MSVADAAEALREVERASNERDVAQAMTPFTITGPYQPVTAIDVDTVTFPELVNFVATVLFTLKGTQAGATDA